MRCCRSRLPNRRRSLCCPISRDPARWTTIQLGGARSSDSRSTSAELSSHERFSKPPATSSAASSPRSLQPVCGSVQVRAVGAGANNPITLGIRASAAGVPLTPAIGNASARGAALLAGAGIGLFDLDNSAANRTSVPLPVPSPRPSIGTTSNDRLTATCTASSKPFNQRFDVRHRSEIAPHPEV